ncbi:MAG: hypothetical protein DRQ39_05995 [Gammaproteobacteria bacterium]|nr:MAG: hypothetical protein DRQ39_05995 [Gammaproteobacteria bacterium]RKZ93731.1 MAG: hypothetical protein DRQ40_07295 [Gammaproteobacteria bacterium]
MLGYSVTGFKICVPLTDGQWSRLMTMEKEVEEFGGYDFIVELEKMGASDVDWSGHYGQNIYFTAEADFATNEWGRGIVEVVINKIKELLV